GDSPAPAQELFLGEQGGQGQYDGGGDDLTADGAAEGPAGVVAAPLVWCVFEGHGVRAGLFTGCGQALQDAEQDQQDGRPDADGAVGGQAADQECRHTHEQQGADHDGFAADLVADVSHQE